jgi:hypothetical protein
MVTVTIPMVVLSADPFKPQFFESIKYRLVLPS